MNDRERLFQELEYDPRTGKFWWTKAKQGRSSGEAGSLTSDGYVRICIDGVMYQAHRLAWLYCVHRWPQFVIDHINGIRDDNRIVNLRDVPQNVNMERPRLGQIKSSSLPTGVDINNGYYRARKRFGTFRCEKGGFLTVEDALTCINNWIREYEEKQRKT